MKTNLIFCLILAIFSVPVSAQIPEDEEIQKERSRDVFYNPPETEERFYEDDSSKYMLRFTYGMFKGFKPVDDPEQTRYSAFIEVFELVDNEYKIIGHGFRGIYSPEGCIYDDPGYLVYEARKIERRMEREDRNR